MAQDKRDKSVKEAKLVEALRANLRRRKTAPAKPPTEAADEAGRKG